MSWKRGQKADRGKRSTGNGGSVTQEAARHRWQEAKRGPEVDRTHRRQSRNRWAVTTAMALALLAFLIWLLLPNPKTPFVVIVATKYEVPVPINAWAMEDGEALQALDRKNMLLADHLPNWNESGSAFELFPEDFDANDYRSVAPVILYLSVHGVVRDNGEPCVLPPGVSIDDPAKWIPVADFLKKIEKRVPPTRHTLLVLDCNRIRENWSLGIVYNTFAERVKELLDRKKEALKDKMPGLAVLVSAGPGQVNWTSADFQGSVFAHYLQLGLAGAADGAVSGESNGDVSLDELASYLKHNVSDWSLHNRGERQEPMLFPQDAHFHVTYWLGSSNPEVLAEALEKSKSHDSHHPADKNNEDMELWSMLDSLRGRDLIRCDPIGCRNFEHQLLQLEELTNGGEAYAEDAKELRVTLRKQLLERTKRADSIATGSRSAAAYYGMKGDASWLHLTDAAQTLPACEYFGVCNAEEAKKVRTMWAQLTNMQLPGPADSIVGGSGVPDVAKNLGETQFFAALRQQQVSKAWDNLKLEKVRDLRIKAEELALPVKSDTDEEGSQPHESDAKPGDEKDKPRESQGKPADDSAQSHESNGKPAAQKEQPHGPDSKPGDERAHYYTRFAAQEADERRRLLEDQLFVGQQISPKQYGNDFQETDAIYDWASLVMNDASSAFHVRDDAFAKGPYLAEWLCDPLSADLPDRDTLAGDKSADLPDRDKPVRDILVPILDGVHRLSDSINDIKKVGDAKYLPRKSHLNFDSLTDAQSGLQAIQKQYQGRCQSVLKALDNPEAGGIAEFRQLEAALRTPLIPAATREKLLEKRTKLSMILRDRFIQKEHQAEEHGHTTGEASEDSHDDKKSAEDYLTTVRQKMAPPLFKILRIEAPGPEVKSDLDWIDQANAAARGGLRKRAIAKSEFKPSAGAKEIEEIATARWPLSVAEADLRAKAALTYGPAEGKMDDDSTIDQLRRFDVLQLLIWNGQRAIADFWQNTVKTDSASPFFARAASGYFQATRKVSEPLPALVAEQITRGEEAVKPKIEQLPINASAQLAPDDENASIVSLDVGDKSVFPYPAGYGAVYLLDESLRRVSLPLQTVPSGGTPYVDMAAIGKETRHFNVNIANASGSAFQAVAFFRGLANDSRFRLPVNKGARIEYVPNVYEDQSITLNGDRLQRSSIDFILDCSFSMKAKTKIKGEAQGGSEIRLTLAKTQLKIMLDELVKRNRQTEEIRVGVRFFGHRVWWADGIRNGTLQVDPDEPALRLLGPAGDIEPALRLGKFNDSANADIQRRIDALEPRGETPLYRALKETLADFQSEPSDSRKYIVAITDGKNDTTDLTSLDEVVELGKKAKVPIYILGFDISPDELAVARPAYEKLTSETGGKFSMVSNGNALLTTLKETLAIDLYSVLGSGKSPMKLNDKTLIDSAQLPKDYTVSFRSIEKPVRLEGGEAIALYMSKTGQNIEARPYDLSVAPQTLLGGSSQRPVALRVHPPLPDKEKNSVLFKFSIQVDPDAYHFTERPLETWVEVTPMIDSVNTGQPYVFYDVNFEPKEPVPVLKWNALNWPKGANQARVRFWCKNSHSPVARTVALRDLLVKPRSVEGVELSAKSSGKTNPFTIQVEERHGSKSSGIYDLHIDFVTKLHYKPLRVVHRFDAQRGVAMHSYEFPAELRENIEKPEMANVVVTRSQDMKDGALESPDGLVVPISPPAEVIYTKPPIQ